MQIVTLAFINEDSGETTVMQVEMDACEDIARWYGNYHGVGNYIVEIDGEEIEVDENGEIYL